MKVPTQLHDEDGQLLCYCRKCSYYGPGTQFIRSDELILCPYCMEDNTFALTEEIKWEIDTYNEQLVEVEEA